MQDFENSEYIGNGEWILQTGHHMVYGTFGRNTFGLYVDYDGKLQVLCIWALGVLQAIRKADYLVQQLEAGIRPVNW